MYSTRPPTRHSTLTGILHRRRVLSQAIHNPGRESCTDTRARRPPLLSLSPTSPRPNERAAAPGTCRYRPSTVLPPPPAPPWHSSLASDPKGRGLSRRALPCRPRAISRRSRGGFRGELGCIRAGLRASAGVSRRCRCRAPRPSPGPPPLAAPKAFLDLAPRTTSPRTAGSACRARSLGGCGVARESATPARWAVCAPSEMGSAFPPGLQVGRKGERGSLQGAGRAFGDVPP